MRSPRSKCAIALGLISALAAPASAQYFQLIDLGSPGRASQAYAINETGEVAGWVASGDLAHGARWQNDQMADIHDTVHLALGHGFLPGLVGFNLDYTEIYGISDARQLVGIGLKGVKCPEVSITVNSGLVIRPATNSDFGTPVPGDALTDLGTFGQRCAGVANSAAVDISNTNYIVGWADIDPFTIHAFLVTPVNGVYYVNAEDPDQEVNDLMHDLGNFGGQDGVSSATAVNDLGQVVGYSYVAVTPGNRAAYHCFLVIPEDTNSDGNPDTWGHAPPGTVSVGRNDLMADLGTLGGLNSWGRDINNATQVVGESDTADGDSHAFLWQSGAMTDLGTLGGADSSAAAINSAGDVVGWAEDAQGRRRAFVWRNGVMTDLNTLIKKGSPVLLTEARDINDAGEIVGWGIGTSGNGAGEAHAFRLNPTAVDPNAEEEEDDADPGTGNTSSQNNSGGGSGDPLALLPLIPDGSNNGGNGSDGGADGGDADTQTLPGCGFGLLGMLPLMLAGLACMRLTSIRRR